MISGAGASWDRRVLSGAAGMTTGSRMPVARAVLNGRCFWCLVDTGSERTLVSSRVVAGQNLRPGRLLLTADGKATHGKGRCRIVIGLEGHCFRVTAAVMSELGNLGVDCLLGGDVIDQMGGVTVRRGPSSRYEVRWGNTQPDKCCGTFGKKNVGISDGAAFTALGATKRGAGNGMVPLAIDDPDFVANFTDGYWIVRWKWTEESPKKLQTGISEYKCARAPQIRERYCAELESWISKGWLKRWDGPVEGIIPLLAVFQPTKDKVRPVMDYRELNGFVECHTGDDMVAVCGDKIRKWRQLTGDLKVVDLKSAYLQIRVSKDLWKYQVVKYNGVHYALTRLGFGLSCAPRIMTSILRKVLSLDNEVCRGTDHYIDDIVVQESVVSVEAVRQHLTKYGLETKEPEGLDGGRLLGVALKKDIRGHLQMSRGTPLSEISLEKSGLTKRELFSFCGRLVGHYPVAGWLRPCCSFLKRLGCDGPWDSPVEGNVSALANDLLARVRKEDPVRGLWRVNRQGSVTVWTDASSLGLGVTLEVDGNVVEDASWLRKKSDFAHINVAELEAVARGINLAIAWGFKIFTLAVDSLTVVNWMSNVIDKRSRVKTKSAAEMLVKRRLGVISDTITEYGLTVSVRFVSTIENKADRMTRVPKKWLEYREISSGTVEVSAAIATGYSLEDAIWAAHLPHHLGIDRTLYLLQQIRGDVSREQVKQELAGCEACQRVDPALRSENLVAKGDLAVEDNWSRVAVDITHYDNQLFLSMVDCGPSRFAIWRRVQTESAANIVAQLRSVAIERGPCEELLMDNSTAFRSAAVERFADEWGISLRFRAAYAPGGNGIVERNHRTIKRIAERGAITPEEATFWYNVTPRKEAEAASVPSNRVFKYEWRVPFDVNTKHDDPAEQGAFEVGDEVWVKPSPPTCTKQWMPGRITSIVSKHTVCVDSMPRHVRDIRKRRFAPDRSIEFSPRRTNDETQLWHGHGGTFPVEEVINESLSDAEAEEALSGGENDRHETSNADMVGSPQVEENRLPAVAGEQVREHERVTEEVPEQPIVLRRSQRDRRRPTYLGDYVAS